MPQKKNAIWSYVSSVRLALILLISLAATSILGTVIQQGKEPAFYVEQYGSSTAEVLQVLDLTHMYNSWWFVTLLCLFAINLSACSIERLPVAWRMVFSDHSAIDTGRLEKMSSTYRLSSTLATAPASDRVREVLSGAGWRVRRTDREDGSILLFTHKGAWTRLAVYVVHLSILVILAGALIGIFFGFQAYVFLPEGRTTNQIFMRKTQEPIPLGFDLRCDQFQKFFYPNGMIKEFRSDLAVFDSETETLYRKSVIVNDPLTYGGITFYLADGYPLNKFYVALRHQASGQEQAFRAPPQVDVPWQGTNASFRIDDLKHDSDGAVLDAQITLSTEGTPASTVLRIGQNETATLTHAGEKFSISFRQLFSTALLAKKDPGVPMVYTGFILMVLGLFASFFLSHRRIWIHLSPKERQGTRILVSGTTNKNNLAFNEKFQILIEKLERKLKSKP